MIVSHQLGSRARHPGWRLAVLVLLGITMPCLAQQVPYQQQRLQMVREAIVDVGVRNPRVSEYQVFLRNTTDF